MSQHVAILINGEVEFCGNVEHFDLQRAEEIDGPDGIVMLRLTYAKENA
jgi:hypothetical protein